MLKTKQIEARGFWLGTQNIGMASALKELAAVFAQHIESVTLRFAPQIKGLEAKLNVLNNQKTKAASLWTSLESETNGRPPQVALPVMAVVVAFLLWLGETFLLSPVLDGMGITDPLEQKFVASVVVLAAATLLEVAAQLIRKPGASYVLRIICLLLSGSTLLFLGWWRGAELIYAAALGSGALQSFLSKTEGLTTVVITLLTMILPLGATLSLDWGLSQTRLSWAWRRARLTERLLTKRYEKTAKALEALRFQCEQERVVLVHRRDEFTNAFLQAYELGRAVGARQLSFWKIVPQIIGAGIVLIAGVLIAAYLFIDAGLAQTIISDLARLAIYLLVAAGAVGIYTNRILNAWHRPNPSQLYSQLTPIWRGEAQRNVEQPASIVGDPSWQVNPTPVTNEFESNAVSKGEPNVMQDNEITLVSPRAA